MQQRFKNNEPRLMLFSHLNEGIAALNKKPLLPLSGNSGSLTKHKDAKGLITVGKRTLMDHYTGARIDLKCNWESGQGFRGKPQNLTQG